MKKQKTIKPCKICGYYEDDIAWHYDDCPELEKIGLATKIKKDKVNETQTNNNIRE